MSVATFLRRVYLSGRRQSSYAFLTTEVRLCSKASHSENESSSDSSSSSSEDESSHESEKEAKLENKILSASLPFVNTCGWSSEAISKGAETLGYSHAIQGMFPGGGRDLINFFYRQCNQDLEEGLKKIKEDPSKNKQGTTAFVKDAVELRLRMNIPYMEQWAQAAALHASPANCSQGIQNIGALVDHIWYYAGDRSSDFNWYTKRVTLALVYKSTELCMLQDNSDDYADTWNFLERRLSDLRTVANCIREAETKSKDLGTIGKAGILTALNMVGMNLKSR